MLGGGGGGSPAPVPPPPKREDPAIQDAALRAKQLARKRGGRAATLLRGTGAKLGATAPPLDTQTGIGPPADLLPLFGGGTTGGGD